MTQTDRSQPPSNEHEHEHEHEPSTGPGLGVAAGSPPGGPGSQPAADASRGAETSAAGPLTIDPAELAAIRQAFRSRRDTAIEQFRAKRQPARLLARLTAATDACARDFGGAAGLPREKRRGRLWARRAVSVLDVDLLTHARHRLRTLGGAIEASSAAAGTSDCRSGTARRSTSA
jgi:hypothetical protein